jgi:hypothetical protein
MKVSAQNSHGHIAFITDSALIATAPKTVSSLKGSDRRLDPGVPFSDFAKVFGAFTGLIGLSSAALFGQYHQGDKLRKRLKVMGSPKPLVETGGFDFSLVSVLEPSHDFGDDLFIGSALTEHLSPARCLASNWARVPSAFKISCNANSIKRTYSALSLSSRPAARRRATLEILRHRVLTSCFQ